MEQEEYTKEGIKWDHLRFVDNEEILYLIGLKPYSLLMIIDEQSQLITVYIITFYNTNFNLIFLESLKNHSLTVKLAENRIITVQLILNSKLGVKIS